MNPAETPIVTEETQILKDDGSLSKYFTVLPNLYDDSDLDVYEYRLLGHYKRVCGQAGRCWESVRTTAKHCRMSLGQVVEIRRGLAEKGFIKIRVEVDPKTEQKKWTDVTVVDKNRENLEKYSPKPGGVHSMNVSAEGGVHGEGQGCSPHELKNNKDKEEPKSKAFHVGQPTPDAPASNRSKPPEPAKVVKPKDEERRTMVQRIIAHLNEATGHAYPADVGQAKYVRARLRYDGATEEQCLLVIDRKVAEWQHDKVCLDTECGHCGKMWDCLRPKTLFCSENFGEYLGQAREWDIEGRPQKWRKLGRRESYERSAEEMVAPAIEEL